MYCVHCGSDAWQACTSLTVYGSECKECGTCGRHTSLTYTTPWIPPPDQPIGGGGWGGTLATTTNSNGTLSWGPPPPTGWAPMLPGMTLEQFYNQTVGVYVVKKEPPRRPDGRIDFDRAQL